MRGGTHQVDITELIQPEVEDRRGDQREVVLGKATVCIVNGNRESTQDPLVHEGLLARELWGGGQGAILSLNIRKLRRILQVSCTQCDTLLQNFTSKFVTKFVAKLYKGNVPTF